MKFTKYIGLFFLSLSSLSALAQPRQLADKIIGIVGDKIVLQSDVQNSLGDMQRQGIALPDNAKCYSLEQALNVKALVLQAEKDSLPISDEDIEIELEKKIRVYINQFGSKSELERVAQRTVYQLKEDFRTPTRDQLLAIKMRNKVVDEIRITPNEVKAYFENIPTDSLPFYESEVEIGQIVIYPEASRAANEYAQEQLAAYKIQAESGRDFKTLANLYSDDPGAKQNSGEYEVNRTEKSFDRTWLSKAFTLKPGQISNPFKTQFGYHIIQSVSRLGDDALVRHILKIPQVTSIEKEAAVKKMDSVRAKLIAGTLSFGEAVNKYSEEDGAKFTAGMLQNPSSGSSFLTIDQLDKEMIPALQKLKSGEYSQPIEFADPRGKPGVKIIYLKTRTEPHRENLKDDYSRISNAALEGKKEDALEKWFSDKLKNYYIKIDPAYTDCEVMEKWVKASENNKHLMK